MYILIHISETEQNSKICEFLKSKKMTSIKTIPSNIDPIEFFNEYVSTRTPVILQSFPDDFPKDLNIDFILSKDPNCKIKVESKVNGHFGSSNPRREMSFKEYVNDHLKSGNYYLTTQYSKESNDLDDESKSIQEYCQPPLTNLISYFPTRPKILGNLIPQQVNVWIGCTINGTRTSSGLHHDFHDNLYMVISGSKQFTLYPPKEAHNLYTFGEIIQIWPNGFIQYEPDMRSDGAYLCNVAEWKLKLAEKELQECEEQGLDTKDAEDAIEKAMDECLLFQQEPDLDESEEDEESDCNSNSSNSSNSSNESLESIESLKKSKKRTQSSKMDSNSKKIHSEPNSFSQIDIESLYSKDFSSYPLAAKIKPIQFTLNRGQCLFLPAGWFHEVVSLGNEESDGIHTAFNYWMCPPCTFNYDQPYQDKYWASQWNINQFLK